MNRGSRRSVETGSMPRRGSMTERSALRRSKDDGDGAAARKARRKSTEQTLARQRTRKQNAEFVVNEKWAPPRRPTTSELGAARKTFYELDKDGSGSIEIDELRQMMKSLGQDPSDEELKELISSVDENNDGQIQLREFLQLFCRGVDTKSATSPLQVNDCFAAFGGDPYKADSLVSSDDLCAQLLERFDLEIDCKDAFGKTGEISKGDFEKLLHPTAAPVAEAPPARTAGSPTRR